MKRLHAIRYYIPLFLLLSILACFSTTDSIKITPVTVADFTRFVQATNYVTDAEKFDWSFRQIDVVRFQILGGLSWKCPDGNQHARPNYPITQVSYNDALAYCNWAGVRLPTYQEYWQFAQSDKRPIVKSMPQILAANQVNIVGNTWDLTSSKNAKGAIRLAGGSYLCDTNTCNGTSPERVFYIDKITANTHISFGVIAD